MNYLCDSKPVVVSYLHISLSSDTIMRKLNHLAQIGKILREETEMRGREEGMKDK